MFWSQSCPLTLLGKVSLESALAASSGPQPCPNIPFSAPICTSEAVRALVLSPFRKRPGLYFCVRPTIQPGGALSACDHPSGQKYSHSTCHVAGQPVDTSAGLTCRPQSHGVLSAGSETAKKCSGSSCDHASPTPYASYLPLKNILVMLLPQIPSVTPSPSFMPD